MKIQILVGGDIVSTQIVSEALHPVSLTVHEAKRIALKAALEDRAIGLSDSLRATFRVFDVNGSPIDDEK
jgi:hypothetical protein